jgi:hypothetical protein
MRCMACAAEMILMNVVQDDTMAITGFEHHTFMCSECQDEERRLVFTKQDRAGDTKPTEQTAPPVVPASTAQDEHVVASGLLSSPVEPAQAPIETTVPVEVSQTVAVETTQTVPVQPIHPEPPAKPRTNAWAKVLEKLRKRTTAASETERRAQFHGVWDNLRSVPPPSASSKTLSHLRPDELVQSPTKPVASQVPPARNKPSAAASEA